MASSLILTCSVQRPASRSRNILFRKGTMLSSIFLRMSSSSHCSLTTSHSQPYPHQESASCGKGVPERSDDVCCVKATGHAAKKGKGGSGLRVASRQQHNGGSSRTAGSSARAAAHVQQAVGSITRASVQQLQLQGMTIGIFLQQLQYSNV
jgi:hypothetical protein